MIAYNVYVDEESNHATVVQIHPDSESIEFHLEVAGPQFGRFMELYERGRRIEVHGTRGSRAGTDATDGAAVQRNRGRETAVRGIRSVLALTGRSS